MPEILQSAGRTETGKAEIFRDRGPFTFFEDGGFQGKKVAYAIAGIEIGVHDEWKDKKYGERDVFEWEDDFEEFLQGKFKQGQW